MTRVSVIANGEYVYVESTRFKSRAEIFGLALEYALGELCASGRVELLVNDGGATTYFLHS
jgi:hypothetical protein